MRSCICNKFFFFPTIVVESDVRHAFRVRRAQVGVAATLNSDNIRTVRRVSGRSPGRWCATTLCQYPGIREICRLGEASSGFRVFLWTCCFSTTSFQSTEKTRAKKKHRLIGFEKTVHAKKNAPHTEKRTLQQKSPWTSSTLPKA